MRKLLTGTPYTGEPYVRCGGRGGVSYSDPYHAGSGIMPHPKWIPAFAGKTTSFFVVYNEKTSQYTTKNKVPKICRPREGGDRTPVRA